MFSLVYKKYDVLSLYLISIQATIITSGSYPAPVELEPCEAPKKKLR